MYECIVLNEPHASLEGLYDEEMGTWPIDDHFLNDVVLKWTDWHTDYLFHGLRDERIRTVRFPYSRFVVDAERLWDDPLESIGQGIVYKQFDGYERTISAGKEQCLKQMWRWHQHRLVSNLTPNAILLDCHSFPDGVNGADVDICVGYNEDWSHPSQQTLDLVVNLFEDNGYKVGINNPYSNSMSPQCTFPYESLMIEVNKRAYLQPGTIHLHKPTDKKQSVNEVISQMMQRMLNEPLNTQQ